MNKAFDLLYQGKRENVFDSVFDGQKLLHTADKHCNDLSIKCVTYTVSSSKNLILHK